MLDIWNRFKFSKRPHDRECGYGLLLPHTSYISLVTNHCADFTNVATWMKKARFYVLGDIKDQKPFLRAVANRDRHAIDDPPNLPAFIKAFPVGPYVGMRERAIAERAFSINPGANLPTNVHWSFRQHRGIHICKCEETERNPITKGRNRHSTLV